MRTGEESEPAVLQRVGVLEFVDEQVREAALIMLSQRVVIGQKLEGPQQKLGEVDYTLAPASIFVERKMLDLPPNEFILRLDLIGPQAFLLRAVDQRLQRSRRKAVVIDAVRLVQPLDQRELILRVHDLVELRQAGVAIVCAQHPVAQ